MNDRQLAEGLSKISQQYQLSYIANTVKSRLLKKTLVEAVRSGKLKLNEDLTPGAMAPGMGMDASPARSPVGAGANISRATGFFPDASELEMEAEEALESPLDANSGLAKFVMGSGKGTYRDLVAEYQKAVEAASASKDRAVSVDDLAANLLMPGRDPEEMKKLRSAAARLLRGARTSGVRAPGAVAPPA